MVEAFYEHPYYDQGLSIL